MKYLIGLNTLSSCNVASREGAWIEIMRIMDRLREAAVASREGAWIEIMALRASSGGDTVASREGAWIEIEKCHLTRTLLTSPPVRGRGLKYDRGINLIEG